MSEEQYIESMIASILKKMPKPSASELAKQDQIFAALDDYYLRGITYDRLS